MEDVDMPFKKLDFLHTQKSVSNSQHTYDIGMYFNTDFISIVIHSNYKFKMQCLFLCRGYMFL